MRNWIAVLLLSLIPCISRGQNQTYYQYKTDEATLVFFDKNLSRYIPHMIRMYNAVIISHRGGDRASYSVFHCCLLLLSD